MHRIELLFLASVLVAAHFFALPSSRAQDKSDQSTTQKANAPRASADKYPVHTEQDGLKIGAELLTRKQVAKEFVADVNRCCVVVQVAVYPKKDGTLELSADDFSLFADGSDIPVKTESATALAARLEKKSGSNSTVTASTGVGVGYESGTYTDPGTGQQTRVHGVYTEASVGVGVGVGGVPPGVAERDREKIARELGEKGLPDAKISVPVSGYLYFAVSKPKKDAKYRLEYSMKDGTIPLQLP